MPEQCIETFLICVEFLQEEIENLSEGNVSCNLEEALLKVEELKEALLRAQQQNREQGNAQRPLF